MYGYNVSTYQRIGDESKIPRKDLEKILQVQLDYIYTRKGAYTYTYSSWVGRLKDAKSVGEAAEVFLVYFEGASSDRTVEGDRLLYLTSFGFYQDAKKRRDYAADYLQKFSR